MARGKDCMMPPITHAVRTVIYGAGSAGRAAQACLARDRTRSIVAFADGDPNKISTTIGGLRVVGASALSGPWFDEVVVASQAWREITTLLIRQGIPKERLSVYHSGEDRIAPLAQGAATAPCVLVLTDDCVSPGHGIGAVLLKHLAQYSAHRLTHVYLRRKGDPFWPNSYALSLDGRGEAGSLSPADVAAQFAAAGLVPDAHLRQRVRRARPRGARRADRRVRRIGARHPALS